MKLIPAPLQALLDGRATTMCYCWRVVRRDGLVQGFTDHDRDLSVAGVSYLASSGFTASQLEQDTGMSVDNLTVDGALSSMTINEDDLAAGKYDDALVELRWVNWADTSQHILLSRGSIGEVKRQGSMFSSELRSQMHRLNQKLGRVYQRRCDCVLGDSRCKVNLNQGAYRATGTVTLALGPRTFESSAINGYSSDWFSQGVLTWTSGPDSGVSYDVKQSVNDGGDAVVELWVPSAHPISNGWGFAITAGCSQELETCRDKFRNVPNFQGFPHIPGNDVLSRYPQQGGSNQDGASIVKG